MIDSELKIKIKNQRFNLIEQNIMKKLLDRGYVFENKKKYEEYIQNLDTKISIKEKEIVPNFLLIPSYECNFKCSYCYEQKYNHSIYKKNRQWIKYAFEFIDNLANKYLNCNKMKTKRIL